MQKILGVLLAAGAAAMLFVLPTWAAVDPSQLVKTISAEVIEIVRTRTGAQREAALLQVVRKTFDLPYIGRSVLGTHWNAASEQQRARFLAAVESSEARACSERLGMLAGYTLTIDKVSARADSVWTVDSSFLPQAGGLPIRVVWEVRDSGQGARIADIKVEGVSLFTTRRSEFNSYIQNNSGKVEPLVLELEARAVR